MSIEPVTREEKMLDAIAKVTPITIEPITRKEMFLAKAGGQDVKTPAPLTREEMFLSQISSGGGGSVNPTAPPNDVNFIDYDGTILYSYTVAEAQALTEMPPLPSHDGLICQGWNFDLETVKAYNRPLVVGAMYITDDGKTRLHIRVWDLARPNVPVQFNQSVSSGVTIDWGDGSATQTVSGTGKVSTSHKYSATGDYTISLAVSDGCELKLGFSQNDNGIMGNNYLFKGMLQSANIGAHVVKIDRGAFGGCLFLSSITIPNGVIDIGPCAFESCGSLRSLTIPDSVPEIGFGPVRRCNGLVSVSIPNSITYLGNELFYSCASLAVVTIPDRVTSISAGAFVDCKSLTNITIPDSVTTIYNAAFGGCTGMAEYHIKPTTPPTLENTGAFNKIPADCIMYVPAASIEAYKTATNWAAYADKIRGE